MPKLSTAAQVGLLLSCLLTASCTSHRASAPADTSSLHGLIALGSTAPTTGKQPVSNIRVMGVQETAFSLGAQAGLAHRAKYINAYLSRNDRYLDKIYDFNALMMPNNVLPPVLDEGQNTLNLASQSAIRVANRTYKVSQQARFVTTPPQWRQFLWMDYNLPEPPHESLLPRDKEERAAWDKYIVLGWHKGVEQGDDILAENLAKLKHDYIGMIRYHKLLAMNMVSPPYVSHANLGITGDAGEIRIDDRVLRIVALPGLNPDGKAWRASVSQINNQLNQFNRMEKLAHKNQLVITDKAWQPVIPSAE